MTSKHGIKQTKQFHNEYSVIHSRNSSSCLDNNEISPDHSASNSVIESISNYYSYLGNSRENLSSNPDVNNCFAVRLACFLIDVIANGQFALDAKGYFTKNFYRHCMESAAASGLSDEIHDAELLIIYIKQCLHLMYSCGILIREGRLARINTTETSAGTIYHKIFNAFWNITPWEDIFPSDTESARELKDSKNILKDLLVRHHGAISLDAVANEFFDMTGFSKRNNLLMISFLDFYFFTWLRHFGMIRYSDGQPYAPVQISVTDIGRRSLNSF